MDIRKVCIKHLKNIENSAEIKVLYAVESGSRAWGFSSKNSDYDIRFFYIHKPEWYLSLQEKPDNIEFLADEVLDYAGWDFKKTLFLFLKSNPPLFEWLCSPIVYLEQTSAAQKLRRFSVEFFNPKASMYHYLHMAQGNYKEYLKGNIVWVKKYFYVLRPLLACLWIKNNDTFPPMEFNKLLESQIKDGDLKNSIVGLLELKTKGGELLKSPKIKIINDYIEENFFLLGKYLRKYKLSKALRLDSLDKIFRDVLKEAWQI